MQCRVRGILYKVKLLYMLHVVEKRMQLINRINWNRNRHQVLLGIRIGQKIFIVPPLMDVKAIHIKIRNRQ